MNANVVEVSQLRRIFRVKGKPDVIANDDLTLQIKRGEVFGLLGHNGAGKTTLIMQIMGLLPPTSGQIHVEGIDVTKDPDAVKALVGYLPQSQVPLRYVEVRQALHFTGRLRGLPEHETRQQVSDLLEMLDLGQYAKTYVNQLSGGLLRITNFAMALMGYPQLIVLDEPSNNLDPQRRRQMWDIVRQLNHERGLTCILVTHNISEAEQIMHRVAVLQHGKLIIEGTPGTIKQNISQRVQLDIWLKSLEALPETFLSRLPVPPENPRFGYYRLQLPIEQALSVVDLLMETIGFDALDDFRMAPLSLEDVYLNLDHAITQPSL